MRVPRLLATALALGAALVAFGACSVGASTASIVATPTATATATATAVPTGSISGTFMYPGGGIPPLRIYAFKTTDYKVNFHVDTPANHNSYTISGVAPGTYYIVAYPQSDAYKVSGGYTKAVPCGLSVSCTDHSLIPVTVKPSENVTGIGPSDWYAPDGAFPPRPF